MVAVVFTAAVLGACSTPRAPRERVEDPSAASLDRHPGISAAYDQDEEPQSNDFILTASGSRPPPRPPPVPPRSPGRIHPRDKENEPTRPGRVPGRRLAGPPDAPYWELVFEIQWRGGRLQGPKPTPPQRTPSEAAEPAPSEPPRPAQQQRGQPTQTPPRSPRAARGTEALAARAKRVHGALDPIAQSQRTTAVLQTSGGNIVAGGAHDLTPAQRALLGPGEVAVKLPGAHAEVTALLHAKATGLTPEAMAVTRAICAQCAAAIEATGGRLTGPTTAIWP